MFIYKLKFLNKWIARFHGRAIAVGNTNLEALKEGFNVIAVLLNK